MCTGCWSGPVIVGSESLVWMVPEPAFCELPCDAYVRVELRTLAAFLGKGGFRLHSKKDGNLNF